MSIEAAVKQFQSDLLTLKDTAIFDRYLLPEACKADLDFDPEILRQRIARRFEIDINNVIIVGSAKVGFSIVNKRSEDNIKPAFSAFSSSSDIDIAIISPEMFEKVWDGCLGFWHRNRYRESISTWDSARPFRDYIFRGWMRPDKLPSVGMFFRREWFEFFRRLESDRAGGDYPIRAGLYRHLDYLRLYHSFGLEVARDQVRGSA